MLRASTRAKCKDKSLFQASKATFILWIIELHTKHVHWLVHYYSSECINSNMMKGDTTMNSGVRNHKGVTWNEFIHHYQVPSHAWLWTWLPCQCTVLYARVINDIVKSQQEVDRGWRHLPLMKLIKVLLSQVHVFACRFGKSTALQWLHRNTMEFTRLVLCPCVDVNVSTNHASTLCM